ncbi:hypothetical protein ACFXB3_15160 [Streptomyces sp. NPDC059447]
MLERTLKKDRTEVTLFRYLAAGDYWFNDEGAGDLEGPISRLHT